MLTGWLAFFFSLIDVVQDELCDVRRLFISSVVVVVMCDTHTGQQTRTRWRRVLYKKRRRRRVRHIVDDQSDYLPSYNIQNARFKIYTYIYGWMEAAADVAIQQNKQTQTQTTEPIFFIFYTIYRRIYSHGHLLYNITEFLIAWHTSSIIYKREIGFLTW